MWETSDLSGAQEVFFTGHTLSGYCISGIIYLLLPVIAFGLMKKYNAAKFYPVIVGIIVYFLAVQFSNLSAHLIGFSQSVGNKTVLAAEMVCYFEEAGRWLAMRYPVTDIRKNNAAICYGIGHGGLECWIRGFQKLGIFRDGKQLNAEGISSFLAGKTDKAAEHMTRQMQLYADHPLSLSILETLHSITSFGFHIALSLLIFRKMQETNYQKRWLLLAILLHICMNLTGWITSFSENPYLSDFAGLLCGTAIIVFVCKIVKINNVINEIKYPLDDCI
ncbi:MAG: YhfC family intramembrane metalloprotease [Oscillospiraceae bacterium]|nr:YhfC family intramembrane metalloprotease [Oscillospiraceae bacterium]